MQLKCRNNFYQLIKEYIMYKYRFIGGLILVIVSAIMFLAGYGTSSGRTAIAVIGIVLIAVSRKKMRSENLK